jgi:hypothetical protein
MHISIETTAFLCLVIVSIGCPLGAAALLFNAAGRMPTLGLRAYLAMGLAIILIIIWIPLVASIPTITQAFI